MTTYITTSVSQIATQIKYLDAKIKSALNEGRDNLFLDWDSNEMIFSKGYVASRISPMVITTKQRYQSQAWEDSSDLLKALYWKATSTDYIRVRIKDGNLFIELCSKIPFKSQATYNAITNHQKSIYDCKNRRDIRI